jgi:ABC-2 type transport system permease protein
MNWARLLTIVRKEIIQIRRDRTTLMLVIGLPVVELLLFGYALNTVVDHLPMAVYDQSQTAASRQFAEAFQNSTYFDIRLWATSREEALRAVDSGAANVALIIPPNFGDQVLQGQPTTAQLVIDGSNPNIAQTALFTGGLIAQVQSSNVVDDLINRLGESSLESEAGIDLRPVVLYNPRMLTTDFMTPGIIALVVQLQAVLLTAFAVVAEREGGTLEQLVVSPIKPLELMLGKALPNALLALISIAAALAVARVLFGVQTAGSLTLLFLMTVPFLLGSLGVGLAVSVVSKTRVQAQQMAVFTFMPSMLLSGFIFPREGMPAFFQLLGLATPMTYYLQIMRGIILKGVGFAVLWPQFLALCLYAALMLVIAVSQFHKTLA